AEVLDALLVQLARGIEVAAEEGEVAEVYERCGDGSRRSGCTCVGERSLEARARVVELSLLAGEDPCHVQRLGTELRRLVRRQRHGCCERVPPLSEIAVELPDAADTDDEPECRLGVAFLEREREGLTQVVQLVLDPREPRRLVAARQPGPPSFGESDEVRQGAAPQLVVTAEPLGRVLPHDCEHPEALAATADETLVDEGAELFERCAADRFRSVERPAPGEDAELREQTLCVRLE